MQCRRSFLLASLFALCATGASAQTPWPTRPVSLVVPFAAGGPTDVVARSLANSMSKTLGQTVLVENKLGAGGTVAAAYVARAQPDGYTFFIHHNGMATAPALYRKLSFNPLTDFEYVSQAVDVPMTLLARKDFPAKNLQELIAYVKANESKINLANAGLGAVSQLCGLMFERAIGVKLTAVPFQGTAPAMARGPGRPVVRPDHPDHSADQGRRRQALWRDDEEPHQGAARCADAGRAGPEGF
jgi:tripartite-type tricarboxylate transporter receptor subunit TctC